MKVIGYLFIVITAITIEFSCGCEKVPATYKITEMTAIEERVEMILNEQTSAEGDSILKIDKLEAGDTVHHSLLGLRLGTSSHFLSYSGCDPQPVTPTQKFTSIMITSSLEYVTDARTYQAGESLQELFELEGFENLESVAGEMAKHNFAHYFRLKFPPTTLSPHDFTFFVTLDDGSTFSATTELIHIAP